MIRRPLDAGDGAARGADAADDTPVVISLAVLSEPGSNTSAEAIQRRGSAAGHALVEQVGNCSVRAAKIARQEIGRLRRHGCSDNGGVEGKDAVRETVPKCRVADMLTEAGRPGELFRQGVRNVALDRGQRAIPGAQRLILWPL